MKAAEFPQIGGFNQRDPTNAAWAHIKPLLVCTSAAFCTLISCTIDLLRWGLQQLANPERPHRTCRILNVLIAQGALTDILKRVTQLATPMPNSSAKQAVSVMAVIQSLESADALTENVYEAASKALMLMAGTHDQVWKEVCLSKLMESNSPNEPSVAFDSDHIFCLNKPQGWTVTVQQSDWHAAELADEVVGSGLPIQAWLQEHLQNCAVVFDARSQHGVAHRLDRDTSGLLLCSKSYAGYYASQLSFAARRVTKGYLCLCRGSARPAPWSIHAPLCKTGRPGAWRSIIEPNGRPAWTEVVSVEHYSGPDTERFSLVEVELHTGRLHQIRAHMSSEGHPLVGDVLYGGGKRSWCSRLFLHACHLSLDLGEELGGILDVRSPLPPDLQAAVDTLTKVRSDGPT